MILRDKPLFRTLARMPSHLIPRAFETIAAIEAAFPNLPGQDDEFEVLLTTRSALAATCGGLRVVGVLLVLHREAGAHSSHRQ